MKRFFLFLLLFSLSIFTVLAESRLDKIQKKGVLRIGVTGDFNPMNFINPAKETYEGFDVDMVRELAKDMKVELEFVKTDWKTLINGVIADKYDITGSASLNPGRALVAGYTRSYMEVKTVPLILRRNRDKFKGWGDLNRSEVKIATTLGTVFEDEARLYFPDSELVSLEPPARDYQEVLSGRAEGSITSNVEAGKLLKQYSQLAVVSGAEGKNRKPLAMLVDKDDQVWINYLNHWIEFKEAQGFFPALRAKWLGE